MKLEGKVGVLVGASDNSVNTVAAHTDSSVFVTFIAGKYKEAALNGRLFSASNQAAVNTTAALTTTWTGLGVANPTGSGKNIVVHEFGFGMEDAGTDDGCVGLMTTTDSGFARAITPRPGFWEFQNTSIAMVDDGATIGTPILERICGTHGVPTDTAVGIAVPQMIYYVDGSIVLPAARSVCTYTTTATTGCMMFYYLWEEVEA